MTGKEKLLEDLNVLEQMAEGMEHYLAGETLFGSALDDKFVQPTIGGYLMRQHRLLALQDKLLNNVEQIRLETAIKKFDQAVARRPDRFQDKASRELSSRVQQWDHALRELIQDPSPAYYRTDVEKRVMITALSDRLSSGSGQQEALEKVKRLDDLLRRHWAAGAFVWPEAWQPAYPPETYWWLYGRIKA